MLLQTVDPFNPQSQNTHIEGDGVRAAGVMAKFHGVAGKPSPPGVTVNVGNNGRDLTVRAAAATTPWSTGQCRSAPVIRTDWTAIGTASAVNRLATGFRFKARRPRRRRTNPYVLPSALLALAGALYASSFVNLNTLGAAAGPLQGRASVVDGDTVEIAGQRVRFNGIDAPEAEQQCEDAKHFRYSCGAKAAAALDDFLAASRPLRCEFVEWDHYSRYVGDCFRADGLSVAAWLVEQGHALDWPKYSDGAYASQQGNAKAAGRGLWSGFFQEPWAWRAEHPRDEPSTSSQAVGLLSGGCDIKGNISVNTGERIYHVPGQEHYSETRISSGKGERWFCSEDEARKAGWRRARR